MDKNLLPASYPFLFNSDFRNIIYFEFSIDFLDSSNLAIR